jgi:hypothetical protein
LWLLLAACEDDGTGAVASGLTSPVALVAAPGSSLRFVVDQAGQIRLLRTDGTLVPTPFLDVRSRMVTLSAQYDERGLLGLAYHPSYGTNGRGSTSTTARRCARAGRRGGTTPRASPNSASRRARKWRMPRRSG